MADDIESWLEFLSPTPCAGLSPSTSLMPELLARSLTHKPYHPRSDRHSVIKCIGLLVDLLRECPQLARDLRKGVVGFGVNSKVAGKDLDLVLGKPAIWNRRKMPRSLRDIANSAELCWSPEEQKLLEEYGDFGERFIKEPLLVVEAKAMMTGHGKARSRVSDEMKSVESRIHQTASEAIVGGLVMINTADSFVSPLDSTGRRVTTVDQPYETRNAVQMLERLPQRQGPNLGFDALGAVFVECRNDGSSTQLQERKSDFAYDGFVTRLAELYESR